MHIVWVTDIHLDCVDAEHIERLCLEILATDPAALLIGGDIGEAPTVEDYLWLLESYLQRPIYFVLGNHDFYQGSITQVRKRAEQLTHQSPWLHWLPIEDVVELTSQTCLVGHDTWADGRLGDFQNSPVQLNDYFQIEELRTLSKHQLRSYLQRLGDEAAGHFSITLPKALAHFRHIILLTHVPPFQEACLYKGKPGHDHWLPHFTCKAVGDVIMQLMPNHPSCQLTVLSGHTHNAADLKILPNLRVKTGAAEYGKPQVQALFNLE